MSVSQFLKSAKGFVFPGGPFCLKDCPPTESRQHRASPGVKGQGGRAGPVTPGVPQNDLHAFLRAQHTECGGKHWSTGPAQTHHLPKRRPCKGTLSYAHAPLANTVSLTWKSRKPREGRLRPTGTSLEFGAFVTCKSPALRKIVRVPNTRQTLPPSPHHSFGERNLKVQTSGSRVGRDRE